VGCFFAIGCRQTGHFLRHIFGTLFLLLAIAISLFSTEVTTKRLCQSLLQVNIAGLRTGSAVVSEGASGRERESSAGSKDCP
jgi:hypothetical protein